MNENQEMPMQPEAQAQAPAEKMVPQSQVNELIRSKMGQAAANAKAEAQAEYQRRLEEMNTIGQRQQEHNQTGSREADADQILQQVQQKFYQELQNKQMQDEATRIAQSYLGKMAQGPDLYEDFNAVTGKFDPLAFPEITCLVAGMDNAADIMYELSKNPNKLVTIDNLAKKAPNFAHQELLGLARSISENRLAMNENEQSKTSGPLDRLQPSRAAGSNGKMSIKDYKSASWLKA